MRDALLSLQVLLATSPLDLMGRWGFAGFICFVGITCIAVSYYGLRQALAGQGETTAKLFYATLFWSLLGIAFTIALAARWVVL